MRVGAVLYGWKGVKSLRFLDLDKPDSQVLTESNWFSGTVGPSLCKWKRVKPLRIPDLDELGPLVCRRVELVLERGNETGLSIR